MFVSGVVVCCRCHWESRPQEGGGICSGLGHVARRCFGTKWYDEVPGARSTRDGDTGSFARFFKLDKYAMFSFAMTSGLASDSDKFKIIITLRRAQKFGDTGPQKNFIFLNNPLTDKFFWKFELNAMGRICPISLKGLNKNSHNESARNEWLSIIHILIFIAIGKQLVL